VAVLADETLKMIARELVATVRKNATIDWTVRENVRAGLRVFVKRILRKYGYPPTSRSGPPVPCSSRPRCCRRRGREAEQSARTTRSVKKPARWILRLTGRPCRCNIVGTKEAGMIKTLQKHGNSQALVIDKGIMEALGIDLDSPLQITVSGNSLIVTPVHVGIGREAVAEAIAELRPKYGKMLERLAK
jgi:antitoxin component of MazEF toxin-antitoxin module